MCGRDIARALTMRRDLLGGKPDSRALLKDLAIYTAPYGELVEPCTTLLPLCPKGRTA